jgi:hypothetical protein
MKKTANFTGEDEDENSKFQGRDEEDESCEMKD